MHIRLWNVAFTKPSLYIFCSCNGVLGILNYQVSLAAFCIVFGFGFFFLVSGYLINFHLWILLPSIGPMGSAVDECIFLGVPKSGRSSLWKLFNRLQMVNKLSQKWTSENNLKAPLVVNFQLKKIAYTDPCSQKTSKSLPGKHVK